MKRLGRGSSLVGALLVALAVPALTATPARATGDFRFAEPSITASESQTVVRVAVHRTDLPVSRASVDYRTEAGTATPASDYAETSGTLTFGVGETYAVFTVLLRDDVATEEHETVMLRLSNASASVVTLTIEDDDDAFEEVASGDGASLPAAPAAAPSGEARAGSSPAHPRTNAVAVTAPRRVATPPRPRAVATPRRVNVRQSPVTPFELRPSPRPATGTGNPDEVDAGLAVLAALVLSRVAAEVWFRSRMLET